MKKSILFDSIRTWLASLAVVGSLFLFGAAAQAGNATTNWFSFDSGIGGWGISVWGGQGANSGYDTSQDHTGNGGGSLHMIDDYSAGDQLVNLGWMGGSMWNGPANNMTGWTNISFWVKWDNTTSTLPVSGFNSPGFGESPQFWGSTTSWGWFTINTFSIPDASTNGWVKVNVPIDPTTPGITANAILGFKKWTGGGHTGICSFWVDDITLEGDPAAVIPPPSLQPPQRAKAGLNIAAITGPYNREQIQTVNGDQSWIGHGSTPVSYSFTVVKGVDGSGGAAFQNHIFLVPSPGTETAPDWNEPNVLFMDLESTGTGGTSWTFRYKTNQPSGNSMMYDGNVVPATLVEPSIRTGTWTLTVVNDNQFTMTSPSGQSTNFTVDAASMALCGASPVTAYFGGQAGNSAGIGQVSVLSNAKIVGTANPLNDTFANSSTLNTNLWVKNAVDSTGVFLTPGNADLQWVYWNVAGAANFNLQSGPSLNAFADATPIMQTQFGANFGALVPVVPGNEFFRLIKRTFTQLQVLLPGQTNAPGTLLGYVGTPTQQTVGSPGTDITVNAVDSTFHIVGGISDEIKITTSDSSASLPANASMVNGTATFTGSNNLLWGSTGTFTVSAQDLTSATVTNTATSASVVVGP